MNNNKHDNTRLIEEFINGEWHETQIQKLHISSIFRLFENDDRKYPVSDSDGNTIFEAKSEPVINNDGVWGINTVPIMTLDAIPAKE